MARVLNKTNLPARDAPLNAGQFYGAIRGQFGTGAFTVTTVAHPAARIVPMHLHVHPFFSMLIRGRYRERFGRRHWDARPLGMVLRPPEAEHCDEIGPGGAVFLCVDVSREFWETMGRAELRVERGAFENRAMSATALRLLREVSAVRPDAANVAEALIVELIAEYVQPAPAAVRGRPRWLGRALEKLHQDPAGASLGAVARELDLHPVHVTRSFKRHTGKTLHRYLRELRLHRATRALLETGDSLAELAGSHGFADQSHLTRELRRATGWSPGRLRCACEAMR